MWAVLAPTLAGAGMGLIQNAEKKKQYKKDMQVQAIKEETSPWTGMHGQYESAPGMMGDVAGGMATGASMGMNYQNMQNQSKLNEMMLANEMEKQKQLGLIKPVAQPKAAPLPVSDGTDDLQSIMLAEEMKKKKGMGAQRTITAAPL